MLRAAVFIFVCAVAAPELAFATETKGYDWILAGKDGIGIGYIPISRLAPAK
jgi:hypothetical protein